MLEPHSLIHCKSIQLANTDKGCLVEVLLEQFEVRAGLMRQLVPERTTILGGRVTLIVEEALRSYINLFLGKMGSTWEQIGTKIEDGKPELVQGDAGAELVDHFPLCSTIREYVDLCL
jgi:hypothetical protein